jgi:hypothetical protein
LRRLARTRLDRDVVTCVDQLGDEGRHERDPLLTFASLLGYRYQHT